MSARAELDELLRLDLSRLLASRLELWEGRVPRGTPLVLAGAGQLGQITARKLAASGEPPVAFVDNNEERWGKSLAGIPILSPADAVRRYGASAAFVVCTYNTARLWAQLEAIGCARVVSYGLLFASRGASFLPFLSLEDPSKVADCQLAIRAAFELLADELSRETYVDQLRARLFLSFEDRPVPVPDERRRDEYFPHDVYRPEPSEVFVDAGAFDGDTIRRFCERRGNVFARAHALEPDPQNAERLRRNVGALPPEVRSRIQVHEVAVSDFTGVLELEAEGTVTSTVGGGGAHGVSVRAERLDVILRDEVPTLVKMDLEGAEPRALTGLRGVLDRASPVLAVTVYHRQDHLWTLPLQVASMRSDYAFFLRAHAEACWDASVYAVPRPRIAAA